MINILNLYAGLGGNRKLWKDCQVTAIEYDPKIAAVYKELNPGG
jgi:DNA (cytosine-5)-methyltransferase 1